jgi:hypothetical protein
MISHGRGNGFSSYFPTISILATVSKMIRIYYHTLELIGLDFAPDLSVREKREGFARDISFRLSQISIPELGMEYENSDKYQTAGPSYDH